MCGIRSRSGDHREEEGEGNGIGRGVKLLSIFSVCLEWGVGGGKSINLHTESLSWIHMHRFYCNIEQSLSHISSIETVSRPLSGFEFDRRAPCFKKKSSNPNSLVHSLLT